jgi:hypothetical protein
LSIWLLLVVVGVGLALAVGVALVDFARALLLPLLQELRIR